MLLEWVLQKFEEVGDEPRVLIVDPLHLLPEKEGDIHRFARARGYTVLIASTNLVFRELYEQAMSDTGIDKLLVIDRAPERRRKHGSTMKAPPPFYPDFLSQVPASARITLYLRDFLINKTGDPGWPAECNNPEFARMLSRNLSDVLRAHENLRNAAADRFTDHDFKTIVAYAALGIPHAAFKKLEPKDYWRIGLLGYEKLIELESIAPEVTAPIRDELKKAPAPFCWLAEYGTENVVNAFYLSVILSQHADSWSMLLANIDPELSRFSSISPELLGEGEAASQLIALDEKQAGRDIEQVEGRFTREAIQRVLVDTVAVTDPVRFSDVIEREKYSSFIRSLALISALDNYLSDKPLSEEHEKLRKFLFDEGSKRDKRFVDTRVSRSWDVLYEAYRLSCMVLPLVRELDGALKQLKVIQGGKLTVQWFFEIWNIKKINRLEYYISALERLVDTGEFLPGNPESLPSVFDTMRVRIRDRVRLYSERIHAGLRDINLRFQELVVKQYPSWVREDGQVYLTGRFLDRVLRPNWDPRSEKAIVLIFDGMRYDIWDEFLRPLMEDRFELLHDYPGLSLLPSETHITRKAICAGTFPDEFDSRSGEDRLLVDGLNRVFSEKRDVEVVSPESQGTGETVRYRAGNLEVFIFELCDKELHKISIKTLPDGRQLPSRPIAFIYEQNLHNIINTEVESILRTLPPGTKVFITADHGFGPVSREQIWLEESWLNEPADCMYLNAKLKTKIAEARVPYKVKESVWELPVGDLRYPSTEKSVNRSSRTEIEKTYSSIIFPKSGYTFKRPGTHFNPDAFTHGGISLQELIIPMVVLRAKTIEDGLIGLDSISGPDEMLEGEEACFTLRVGRSSAGDDEIRVDAEASWSKNDDTRGLSPQVLYVGARGSEIEYRFVPDANDADDEDRKNGFMKRTLTISVKYREGYKTVRKSRSHEFTVRFNLEKVQRRVPAALGQILGLTPKTMR